MIMAEILNRCLKCKCSLSSTDKPSKLLPCLHTMCEECISGRTDVAERIKRLKEEKEQKIAAAETAKREKENTAKEAEHESDKKEEESKEKNEIEDGGTPIAAAAAQSEETTDTGLACEPAKSPHLPDEEKKVEETTIDQPPIVENTTDKKEEDEDDVATISSMEAAIINTKELLEELGDAVQTLSESAASSADTKVNDTDPSETNTNGNSGDAEKHSAETESSVQDNKPPEEKQHTSEETRMEVEEMEEVEETPPDPVPLTECPICREPFNPDTLIENVFIRKNAATSEGVEGEEQKCTGCESNPANSYCLQCDDWLCADCVNAHKRVRMTKDHQLTSLEEARANKGGSAGPVEVSMMCRVHPKEKLTLFCEKCEVLTCRDCQLLQHQEHKYQFLQEAADSYKAKLTGSLSLMKDRRATLKRCQTDIEDRLNKVKKEKGDLQQDILRQADIIVKAVRSSVWSVLSSLHSFTDAAAKRLSREVGDVKELVAKFDHCITFMDGILEDGLGLPLLFSKAIVETKCRKVYHTHMEPQSLKGQLNIQYRHDVPSVIRSLPHIGAIYVNGSKYPPEKCTSQPQSASNTPSSQNSSTYRTNNAPGNVVVGGGAPPPQGIPPHLASQERTLYMQMMMSRQSHANTAPSQPTLSLPGSRRVGGMAPGPRSWPQLGLASGQGGLMTSMMGQGQSAQHQMMPQRAPAFTPMRLHHRPVDPNHMSSTNPAMVLGGPQHRPQHSAHTVPYSSLPAYSQYYAAPPPLRSPVGQPQYRGAAEGLHINSGGQAAMSGVRRQSAMMDSNPDPARPASGGHNTPERPLSSEGAASSMRVKAEPHDNTDCVITSASFKNKKPTIMPGSSLGELQKNLDEVIRGVPLDLGDNLEQINGGDSMAHNAGARNPTVPPPLVTSPSSTMTTNTASKTSSQSATPTPTPPPPTVSMTSTTGLSSSGESRMSNETVSPHAGGMDLGIGMETDGRQVKGYATGNSMPGFSLAAVESADPNDDYCASCHQGGDVLCCDQCPRVFHLQCHIPVVANIPSGTFVCTLCEEGLMTDGMSNGLPTDLSGKRKAETGLSDKELRVCERVMLELFCHPSSIPFHEPVNKAVPNYYKIITKPMDFSTVKNKLSQSHQDHYTCVEDFLDDCKLVFRNCAVYNSETSEVGKAGKIVRTYFDRLVDRHMPEYGSYARRHNESPDSDARVESERKKCRLTPSPAHSVQGEKTAAPVVQ